MFLWDQLENEIEDFRGNIRSCPVGTDISPDRLKEELEGRSYNHCALICTQKHKKQRLLTKNTVEDKIV